MTRTKLAAVVGAACLLVSGLTVASAAHLDVASGSISAADATACTTSTVQVTRTERVYIWIIPLNQYEGVRLTAIPAACQNKEVRIVAGAGLAEGVVEAGATSDTLNIHLDDAYSGNTTTFHLLIDGWSIPATRIG